MLYTTLLYQHSSVLTPLGGDLYMPLGPKISSAACSRSWCLSQCPPASSPVTLLADSDRCRGSSNPRSQFIYQTGPFRSDSFHPNEVCTSHALWRFELRYSTSNDFFPSYLQISLSFSQTFLLNFNFPNKEYFV